MQVFRLQTIGLTLCLAINWLASSSIVRATPLIQCDMKAYKECLSTTWWSEEEKCSALEKSQQEWFIPKVNRDWTHFHMVKNDTQFSQIIGTFYNQDKKDKDHFDLVRVTDIEEGHQWQFRMKDGAEFTGDRIKDLKIIKDRRALQDIFDTCLIPIRVQNKY